MTILNDYKQKVDVRGSTPRSRTVNYRVNNYNETFMRAPEYEQVKLTLNDTIDSTLYDIWLYANSSYKQLIDMKTVLFAPGTKEDNIFSGQYMRLQSRDNRPEELFMIVSNDKQYDTKIKASVDECTETLRWYDDDGNLREYPVVVMNSYRKGLDEDRYMVLTNGQYIVGMPQNEVTRKLQEGAQFILNSKHKYRIAGFEDVESSTFMTVTLDKYEENASVDDLENGIANFANRPRFTIESDVTTNQFSIGDTVQITSTLLDKDGQVSDKPLTYTSSDDSIATVNSNGLVTAVANGVFTVTVSMTNNSSVTDTINMEITATPVVSRNYVVTPDISILYRMRNIEVSVQGFNGLAPIVETYTFEVNGSSTADSNKYEFEVIDNDTFRIKNLGQVGELIIDITPDSQVGDKFSRSYDLRNSYS